MHPVSLAWMSDTHIWHNKQHICKYYRGDVIFFKFTILHHTQAPLHKEIKFEPFNKIKSSSDWKIQKRSLKRTKTFICIQLSIYKNILSQT